MAAESLENISLDTFSQFLHLIPHLKNPIQFAPGECSCKGDLPHNVLDFLAHALKANIAHIQTLWDIIGPHAMNTAPVAPTSRDLEAFRVYGVENEISYWDVYPPTRICTMPLCNGQQLGDHMCHKAVLFTLQEGALPIFSTSVYCHSIYYHNYVVHKETSTRTYYPGVPEIIQLATYYFAESALLEFFATQMAFAWVSAENCSRVYNHTLSNKSAHILNNLQAYSSFPLDSPTPHSATPASMTPEHVSGGFILYSLLLDSAEQKEILVLPHDVGSQRLRVQPAMEARNKAMEGTGQEYWDHACDKCCILLENNGEMRKIQAAVTDGVSIGHPRCAAELHCQKPLPSPLHVFCIDHAHYDKICRVRGCSATCEPGSRTCADSGHQVMESNFVARGKAMFQLHHRLKQAGVHIPSDSSADTADDPDLIPVEPNEPDQDKPLHDGKSESGNRSLRATFGRCRTHNEQLLVRLVAISAVKLFCEQTFPTTPSMPEYLFFDDACHLHRLIQDDPHWAYTATPADVFHHDRKHGPGDTYCQQNVNPAGFPELILPDGKWRFNTSVAEQTNAWIGGFQAMVRQMEVTYYNFFLDEMIKRRNRFMVEELERKGHNPWQINRNALL
ncbi:hypothetical protein BS47DRAFT_1338638 [Hydnum rufescens UP504]|uniref:CxC6 like cysteine cluster associated with KDZ domain-containing protein n=1 Tax=Hydnum rufescens UP504 TaxID=1448309 RepID=A0A9P6B5K9_9AGAM|nr:hypothetical protein BS47DRAFT_1338638 [Hydnum rufescens UP504]